MKKIYNMLAMVLLFGIVAYIHFTFVYSQQPRKINLLKSEIRVLNEKLISAQILARELDLVAKLIDNNLALSARDSLAEDASMPFLNDITQIMNDLGVKLLKLNPGNKVNMKEYIKSPYDMTVECTFEELGKFINRLEKSDRLVTVEGFEVDNAIRKIRDIKGKNIKPGAHEMVVSISTLTLIKR